jgi:predicted enzyme related to lactoylglutathione lyase
MKVADPFEVLRTPVVPVDPSPAFATRLRARLEQELDPERGTPVPQRRPGPDATPAISPLTPRSGDIAYVSLWVPDVERASAFFEAVLGWQYASGAGPQGRQVEGVVPRHGLWGGQARSTLFMCFAVDDIGAAVERVRQAGGRIHDPTEEAYGLVADGTDDQGVRFALVETPVGPPGDRQPPTGVGHGDLAYVSMVVPDSGRARAFYGSVLDWRFSPGHATDGWQVEDVAPMVGVAGGAEQPTLIPMYRVEDIVFAVGRVRGAGGTATPPERQPYGVTSWCTDDQGTSFHLGEL